MESTEVIQRRNIVEPRPAQQITLPDISTFILVLKAVDEADDLFRPNGFTRKNLVEALSKSYDAAAALRPNINHVPKATILSIGLGLFDTITGILGIIQIVKEQ